MPRLMTCGWARACPKDRTFEFGLKDNFWQMGDTGPCGPCSEIHYDMGVAASDQGHTDCKFGCDCGRYVELWNLVFMQFDRDASGKLNPLPKPSIDTGMGLERVAAVLQGVISNYDTDLFTPLIARAAELTGATAARVGTGLRPVLAEQSSAGSMPAASLRVIADHSRAATFLISDGVLPLNEGRGYVLRKIIRRAITHGRLLGQAKPFLHEMVFAVRDQMREAYPELKETVNRVSKVVLAEEVRFAHTLDSGLARLEDLLDVAAGGLASTTDANLKSTLDASQVTLLPTTLSTCGSVQSSWTDTTRSNSTTRLVCPWISCRMPREIRGIVFDQAGFDRAMQEQRERARASWKGSAKQTANPAYQKLPKSEFEGYRQTRSDGCEILAIIHNGQGAQELKPGEEGEVILDHTPFYAESGGQVGDRGWLYSDDHNTIVADVKGCYYPVQGSKGAPGGHEIPTQRKPRGWGTLRVGDKVDAAVDAEIRLATMRNHTATHLLQAGLREVLGKHVKQAGSLVAPNHLRFDFSHFTGGRRRRTAGHRRPDQQGSVEQRED